LAGVEGPYNCDYLFLFFTSMIEFTDRTLSVERPIFDPGYVNISFPFSSHRVSLGEEGTEMRAGVPTYFCARISFFDFPIDLCWSEYFF